LNPEWLIARLINKKKSTLLIFQIALKSLYFLVY